MVINALDAPMEFGYGAPKNSTHERTKQQSIELSLVPVAMVVVASLCCHSLSLWPTFLCFVHISNCR